MLPNKMDAHIDFYDDYAIEQRKPSYFFKEHSDGLVHVDPVATKTIFRVSIKIIMNHTILTKSETTCLRCT